MVLASHMLMTNVRHLGMTGCLGPVTLSMEDSKATLIISTELLLMTLLTA